MKQPITISVSRTLATALLVVLVFGPLQPIAAFAQTTTCDPNAADYADCRIAEQKAQAEAARNDVTPPVIAPQSDITVQAASATSTGAIVSYASPITTDDLDPSFPSTASCSPPSDSTFVIGTTKVTCTASDWVGNSASTTFNVIVQPLPQAPAATSTDATSTPPAVDTGTGTTTATTTPPVDTNSGTTTNATSTPPDSGGGAGGGGQATTTPPAATSTAPDPGVVSSSANSGQVPAGESDTGNTALGNNGSGPQACAAAGTCALVDASATSTEALANAPLFVVATSTNDGTAGTGCQYGCIGSFINTGSALASTTVKNILNITRSNVDGPGVSNSSKLLATTENAGSVTTSDDTRAFTGQNNGSGGQSDATVHTGRATSHAQAINVVNTNFFNSNGMVMFLNPDNGDSLDLRAFDLSYFTAGGVGASPTALGCTILTCLNSSRLSVLNKNEATVNNNMYVRASSGGNSATSTKSGAVDIATGDAYASADVLNMVNTNFINSKYLVATFDNFGSMQGDIVLPDPTFFSKFFANGNTLPDLNHNSSSFIVSNDNAQTFTGTTTANAITGQNLATTTPIGQGHGEVQSGQAHTFSNSYTTANQTHVGGASALFVFHVAGTWNGAVKGLPAGMSWRRTDYGIEVYSDGSVSATSTQGLYNSSNFVASSTNRATVNTDVNVWAETGENTALTEDGTSHISSGNAYASANVVNMVNTNVVNRNFMFVVFNIAGDWQGDIDFGGHSPNLAVTTTVAPNSVAPGSQVTYHFAVTNHGDVPADNVVLSTIYNKNVLTYAGGRNVPSTPIATTVGTNWNIGSLAPGQTTQFDADMRVNARDLQANSSISVPLTANAASLQRDEDITDNTQTALLTVATPGTSGTPPPSGGTTSPTGGGSTAPPSGGGGGPPSGGGGPPSGSAQPANTNNTGNTGNTAANNANTNTANTAANAASNAGGGTGGGGGAPNPNQPGQWTPNSQVSVVKTLSVATTTAPVNVDYKVVVSNKKTAGPAYQGVLTDTLYDPSGAVMYDRSWNLDTIAPGDEIDLTYTVAFATSTKPGTYHNIARVTGFNNYNSSAFGGPLGPTEAYGDVTFLPNGQVLGDSTSTVSTISDASIKRSGSSCPLLQTSLRPGSGAKADVVKLQAFLNAQGAHLPTSGFFGPMTLSAVKNFQLTYASEILTPVGLSSPTGLVYASTLRKINSLACGGADPTAISSNAPSVSTPAPSAPAKPRAPAKTTPKPATSSGGALKAAAGWLTSFWH